MHYSSGAFSVYNFCILTLLTNWRDWILRATPLLTFARFGFIKITIGNFLDTKRKHSAFDSLVEFGMNSKILGIALLPAILFINGCYLRISDSTKESLENYYAETCPFDSGVSYSLFLRSKDKYVTKFKFMPVTEPVDYQCVLTQYSSDGLDSSRIDPMNWVVSYPTQSMFYQLDENTFVGAYLPIGSHFSPDDTIVYILKRNSKSGFDVHFPETKIASISELRALAQNLKTDASPFSIVPRK